MVEVTYRGGNMDGITSNAASEATLELLVKAMSAKGGGSGAQGLYNKAQKTGTAEMKKMAKAQKEATAGKQAETKEVKKVTKELGFFKKGLNTALTAMNNAFAGIGGAAGGMVKEVFGAGTNLSDFSQHLTGLAKQFPIVGGMVGASAQALVSVIDKQIDVTRQINQVGGNLGEGLFGTQLAAAEARMSIDSFAALMGSQSKNLSAVFGGATAGMQQFAGVMKQVKTMDKQFAALGYTVDEQAEYTAEYLDYAKAQGLLEGRNNRQLAKGAQDYMLQLDQLTKITGMSRKEAAAALKAQADDKRLTAILHNMDEGTKANLNAALAQVGNLSPEMGDAMAELVATGGVPISDMGKSMMLLNPRLGEMAKGLKDGSVSQEAFADEIRRSQEIAKHRMKTEEGVISASMAMGDKTHLATLAMAQTGKVGGDLAKAQEDQKKQMEDEQKQVMNFQQVIVDLRNTIMKELINSKIFDEVVKVIGDVTTWIGSEEGMMKIKSIIKSVTDGISGMITWLKETDFGKLWDDNVKKPLENLKGLLPDWVKNMIFGKGEKNAAVEKAKTERANWKEIEKEMESMGVTSKVMADGTIVTLDEVKAKIVGFDKEIADAEGGEGWFKTLSDNIWLVGGAVAAVLAAGMVIPVAIAGLALLLKLFANGPTAIGAAVLAGLFIGTGYAINLAGEGIKNAGAGVDAVAKAMKDLSEIKNVANLKEMAGIMGDLSGALLKFAIGGKIADLMDAKALPNLAESLKAFESVNASALAQVGPGIAALYEGTSKFTGDGAWEGFSKWVGSLFGGDNNFEQMAEGIKNFEGIDGTKLANLGEGLGGIAEFVNSINAASDLDKQVKAVRQLVKVMEDYTKQYNKMSGDMQSSFNMAVNNSGKETVEALNELNTVIKQLVYEQQESNKIGNKIVGAVNEGGAIG